MLMRMLTLWDIQQCRRGTAIVWTTFAVSTVGLVVSYIFSAQEIYSELIPSNEKINFDGLAEYAYQSAMGYDYCVLSQKPMAYNGVWACMVSVYWVMFTAHSGIEYKARSYSSILSTSWGLLAAP